MSKVTKIVFDRDGKINAVRVLPKTDEILSMVNYAKGSVHIKHDGFDTTIHKVDEVVMMIKPLDTFISEVSFLVKNEDGGKQKLDVKLYGTITEHLILDYEGEQKDAPKKVKRFKIEE